MFGPELVGPNLEINFVNSLEADFPSQLHGWEEVCKNHSSTINSIEREIA